jgi:nicotinamidase-related amidase
MDFVARGNSSLVVVDLQERIVNAIPEERRSGVLKNSRILIEAARTLGVPVLATEQYPKGLGPTVPEIKTAIGESFHPIEKTVFSCGRSPEFRAALESTHRQSAVLCGIESHVCVLQTAMDLVNAGYHVYVPADAVASRRELDWQRAIDLLDKAGAIVGTTETFVFQWLERAATDEFRTVSKLFR